MKKAVEDTLQYGNALFRLKRTGHSWYAEITPGQITTGIHREREEAIVEAEQLAYECGLGPVSQLPRLG